MLFALHTRLPCMTSVGQRTEVVDSVIQVLGLADVRHELIGAVVYTALC